MLFSSRNRVGASRSGVPISALIIGAACGLASVACSNESSKTRVAPEVSGLAAVPASAEVVIVADLRRIMNAPLVTRAFEQLLARDPALAARWAELRDRCKLDAKQLSHVSLAIGPHAQPQPGTGPVLIVASGRLVEAEFAACVRAMVGKGGGSLTAKPIAPNNTLYVAKQGNHVMYFAFGRADTVILGATESFVVEAVGAGKKILDHRDMAQWIGLADQRAPMWAVGKVDVRVRDGLIKVMAGSLSSGPRAFFASFDPTGGGAAAELGAVMASGADAKALESFAKIQLSALGMAAQAKSLGSIVSKVQISATCPAGPSECATVRFAAKLGAEEVNQLISALDGGGGSAQISPPQTPTSGSGSAGS